LKDLETNRSCLRCALPVARNASGARMQRAINMLVADDERMIQDLIVEAARGSQLPLRISTTDNGRDCLTLLNGGNIDLAFIDIHMPELSGMEAIWVARKQGVSTFITVMSGAATPDVFKLVQKLKAYEFLVKPFTIDGVIAIMNTYARVSAPMKVLIVDDSSTVRSVVQKVIQQSIFKCEIAEAADAASAIERCRQQSFDTVLLDCNMPNIDGMTALRQLRKLQPGQKVIMISSERNTLRERQAREAGAHGFLYKPFYAENIDRMLHAVHRLRLPTLNLGGGDKSVPEMLHRPGVTGAPPQVVA
jgi:CheY-like chemotaxis protein